MKGPRKNIVGNKYNHLTVVEYTGRKKGLHYEVVCRCECGNTVKTTTTNLISNKRKSCGCKRQKHGMSFSPEYSSWKNMKGRCNNANNNRFEHYGARGIKVCERWNDSFENFFTDMGEKPGPEFSIERVDVNGGYTPDNCIWGDPATQSRNKREQESKTNVRGVHPMPDKKKYKATIGVNNKTRHIGVYDTIEKAKKARKQAELKYWGKVYA